jgi:hypothetical protein
MPANRAALYNGILRDRGVQRLAYCCWLTLLVYNTLCFICNFLFFSCLSTWFFFFTFLVLTNFIKNRRGGGGGPQGWTCYCFWSC